MPPPVILRIDIRALRKEGKMSLETWQELIGIDKSILARCETGATPCLAHALRIARFLHVPVEEIWAVDLPKTKTRKRRTRG